MIRRARAQASGGRGHSTESVADGSCMKRFMLHRVVLRLVITCAVASCAAAKVSAESCGSDQSCGSDSACVSNVPRSLFYVGAGAGLGVVASGEQSVTNTGISNFFEGEVLFSTGTATGP